MHDSQDQMMRQIEIKKEEYIFDKKELLEDQITHIKDL